MNRDGRREVAPPIDLTKNLLASGYVLLILDFIALNSTVCVVVFSVNLKKLRPVREFLVYQHLVNPINGIKFRVNFYSAHVNSQPKNLIENN